MPQINIKENRGITLIEIIITIGLIFILTVTAIINYNRLTEDNALYDASRFVIFLSQQTQEDAKHGKDDKPHGFIINDTVLDQNQIVVFADGSYYAADRAYDENYYIPDRLKFVYARFYDTPGVYFDEVAFSKGKGVPNYANGEIRIEPKNEASHSYVILTMNSEGRWTIDEGYE